MTADPRGSRPLARVVHGRRARALAVRRRRLGRPRRLLAARARAQGRGRAERSRERALRGRRAARRALADRRGGTRRRGRRPLRADGRPSGTLEIVVDAERASLRRLVRALPALVGRLRRRREAAARARGARLRRALPAADPPDRAHAPQGPQQLPDRAALRSGQPVGDRRRGRRAHRARTPSSAATSDVREPRRRRARRLGIAIALDFAIQCSPDHPWLTRASGLVPPPARRHAQVRREPAQALPGHLQRQLRHRGLARALERAARRRAALGRARRHGVPRRQPAHEADRRSGSG